MALLDPFSITVRLLETREEYEACVALQRETWGERFADCVPATIMMISQRIGGVTAGAFDSDGRLLGFVFGITGVQDGRPVHWSDMLAVHHDARGLGLGKRLKTYQREILLKKGVEVAYWTYDPLVARNAHLNLNTLGARPIEYVPNMYGETGSPLHAGLDTDRFIVEWVLADPHVERALAGQPPAVPAQVVNAPIVGVNPLGPLLSASLNARGAPQPPLLLRRAAEAFAKAAPPLAAASPLAPQRGCRAGDPALQARQRPQAIPGARGPEPALPEAPCVRVEIPAEIVRLKAESPETARDWQRTVRDAFLRYLPAGYRVTSFYRDDAEGRYFYVVTTEHAAS